MSVRAKMRCEAIVDTQYGPNHSSEVVKFRSQYDDKIPEDQRFQKATPSASAEFQIDNPEALKQFEPGKTYYLDFTPAEA
jgi:hypothetical protein